MINRTYRLGQSFLCCVSTFAFCMSLYFQYVKDLQPCPLCLMQRACVLLLIVTSLIAVFFGNKEKRFIFSLQCILVLCGIYFAARQLWLQSLPASEVASCLPGLDILVRYFPWQDILHALLFGAADCGEVTWRWWGISMANWAMMYFLFAGVISISLHFFPRKKD